MVTLIIVERERRWALSGTAYVVVREWCLACMGMLDPCSDSDDVSCITLAIIDRFPLCAAAPCGKRCGEDLEAAVVFRTVIALLGVPVEDPYRVV
ncbi:hypothetical protein C2S52_023331 [Perilla frutescens var. hirtella]|nr:hypothetical protein C2S52_023331 [Perilla frutescens var. hirtella]